MVFRVCANHFRITYSQANDPRVTKETIYNKWKDERNLKYICVAKELHQDEGIHYHVHLHYDPRKDVRNEKYYDIPGIPHPNVQKADNPGGWNRYVKEDGDYLENTPFQEEEEDNLYNLARSKGREEYFEYCRKKKIQFQYAAEAWNYSHIVDSTIEPESAIQGNYNHMLNWYECPIQNKATVIIGETGIGKTVYAKTKSTKPALFISHMDDLKRFDPRRHKSIIFDDMCFTHFPVTGQIHLVDLFEPRSIHIRYGTVQIPAGVERWFTCNKFPFDEHPAIRRRINLINLY